MHSTADKKNAVISLLYSPLATDLPPVNKDLLILHAAYSGNIDRYTRLRRPSMLKAEGGCVVRGIYHETMFAKWWSLQPELPIAYPDIRRAINARFIMNNDLSRITKNTKKNELPYLIWYPHWANSETYEELTRRKPSMKPQAARACIIANYQDAYNRIQAIPDIFLVEEARISPNPYYLSDLVRKAAQMGIGVSTVPDHGGWKRYITRSHPMERRDTVVNDSVSPSSVGYEDENLYNGIGANLSTIELFVCVPPEIRNAGPVDLQEV
jgi:hypothetical protein